MNFNQETFFYVLFPAGKTLMRSSNIRVIYLYEDLAIILADLDTIDITFDSPLQVNPSSSNYIRTRYSVTFPFMTLTILTLT